MVATYDDERLKNTTLGAKYVCRVFSAAFVVERMMENFQIRPSHSKKLGYSSQRRNLSYERLVLISLVCIT